MIAPPAVARAWKLPGVDLSPRQKRLVYALAVRPGRLMFRDQLIAAIYADRNPDYWPESQVLNVMVSQVRKKLRPLGVTISTVWAEGYRLDAPQGFVWPWQVQS